MNNDVKIIQIVPCPNDATWQGTLFGLGSDGIIYKAEFENENWIWCVEIPLNFKA